MKGIRILEQPNLPFKKVVHAVVSAEYKQILLSLQQSGIIPIKVEKCNSIISPVSEHADMLFSYIGNGKYICEKSQQKLRDELDSYGFECQGEVELLREYPHDISLNHVVIGKNLVCKVVDTPEAIKNIFHVINVNQGYTKCSCAVVDENSIITDDESIFNTLSKLNFDVLLVRKGSVRLKGLNYGFIGGCCGKIAKDTLAFCGDIRTHSDYKQISAFLAERKVYPLSLAKGELIDIGSIIPVTEYV